MCFIYFFIFYSYVKILLFFLFLCYHNYGDSMFFLLTLISFIPVFLLGLYIYKKDSVREPKSLLIGLFFSGFVSVLITTVCNAVIMFIFPDFYLNNNYDKFNFFTLFMLIFLEIGLVEEFSKWIMVKFLGYNNKDFDQLYDIIVYSVFVSLGFALIENIFYVLDGGVFLGVVRGIVSVPAHASFGVLMGYFLGLAKISWIRNDHFSYIKNMILSLLIPVFFHTIFNFCLMGSNAFFLLVFFGFVIFLFILAILKVNQFSKFDQDK